MTWSYGNSSASAICLERHCYSSWQDELDDEVSEGTSFFGREKKEESRVVARYVYFRICHWVAVWQWVDQN